MHTIDQVLFEHFAFMLPPVIHDSLTRECELKVDVIEPHQVDDFDQREQTGDGITLRVCSKISYHLVSADRA